MFYLRLFIGIVFIICFSSSYAGDRTALVIGNYKYMAASSLRNPEHDVTAISRVLEFMGYEVILKKNLNSRRLKQEIDSFKKKRKGKISLIYYSGHGVQVNGVNYLVPIDFGFRGKNDLIRMNDFLASVSHNARYGVAIFDACRNNPFGQTISSRGFRDLSIKRKITKVRSQSNLSSRSRTPKNTFIAFATKHGKKALEGKGYYSPYAEALINFLPEDRSDVFSTFGKIRDYVQHRTRNYQEPYTYGSIGRKKLFLTQVPELKFFYKKRLAVSKNEITVSEYLQCVIEKACKNPEWLTYGSEYHIVTGKSKAYKHLRDGDKPIVGINWYDAVAYTRWLSKKTKKRFKLLSDREWLSVAGKNINISQINCDGCNNTWGGASSSPVGSFNIKNGLNDMFGNVWEWVCSNGDSNSKCGKAMLRGGSWMSSPESIMKFEQLYPPAIARDVNIGFRVGVNL